MMTALVMIKPDDWHVHFRDDEHLFTTVPATARCFGRAIVMPNLNPPVTRIEEAETYFYRIKNVIPDTVNFTPLMTLYLTPLTDKALIIKASQTEMIKGVKLYPAGATTLSEFGVHDIVQQYPVFEEMEKQRLPLLIHGEVTDPEIDIFDRERIFIEQSLVPIRDRFPELPIVLEHITTKDAVDYITECTGPIGATITIHHLLYNRNHLLAGGIAPHLYCLPIIKRQIHQQALRQAATSGNAKFFLGTDSAPHSRDNKQSACGCAGIFSAHCAIELYAQVFEEENALDKLEAFASKNGADFYGLPYNEEQITLVKQDWQIPKQYPFGCDTVIPMAAGETIHWQLKNTSQGSAR